jgi:hypothetical protein
MCLFVCVGGDIKDFSISTREIVSPHEAEGMMWYCQVLIGCMTLIVLHNQYLFILMNL